MTARLRLAAPCEERPVDIYASIKAEREAIDWRAVHIRGDRSSPVDLADRRKGWRG